MSRAKHPTSVATACFGLFLGLLVCGYPILALADSSFVVPKRGLPGRREGGGTRGCIQSNPSRVIALLPDTNLGLTTAAYPRFFWYVPKTTARQAEFALYDVDESQVNRTLIYKTTFRITGTPGVASLTLPNNATIPPLVVNQDYRWSLTLICNPSNDKANLNINGWVQRVAPSSELTNQLAKADPRNRVALYAQNGLWFDTLTTLAELRCARPKDASLATGWSSLLKQVNLSAIADQPLIQQCSGK